MKLVMIRMIFILIIAIFIMGVIVDLLSKKCPTKLNLPIKTAFDLTSINEAKTIEFCINKKEIYGITINFNRHKNKLDDRKLQQLLAGLSSKQFDKETEKIIVNIYLEELKNGEWKTIKSYVPPFDPLFISTNSDYYSVVLATAKLEKGNYRFKLKNMNESITYRNQDYELVIAHYPIRKY